MAIPRVTANQGLRGRNRQAFCGPAYPKAALWALRALIEGKGYKTMAKNSAGPDESILELLGMEEMGDEPVKPKELLERLLETRDQLNNHPAVHPAILQDNLRDLGHLLGLSPLECEVLALMVYRDLLPGMYDACYHTEPCEGVTAFAALIACMLEQPASLVLEALSFSGKLYCSGLLKGASSYRSDPVQLATGLGDALLRHPDAASEILRQYSDRDRACYHQLDDFQHLSGVLDILTAFLLGTLQDNLKGVNILIHGRPGTGKTQLARALASHLKVTLHEIRSAGRRGMPIAAAERFSSYRFCQSLLAGDNNALLLFDECDDVLNIGESNGHKAWINNILEENPRPSLWLCNDLDWFDPAFVRRFNLIIEMPALSLEQRAGIACKTFAGLPVTEAWLQRLVEHGDLQAAHLATAAKVVRAMHCSDAGTAETAAERVLEGLGSALGLLLSPSAIHCKPDELVFDPGLANADQDLGHLLRALGRSRSGRLCLFGPPGTGKSQFARHLAMQLKVPLIERRASDLLSPFVGKTERNIANAFTEASQRGAILLIDEADGMLFSRNHSSHQWEVSQVNELLQQMERYQGILIMTTNNTRLIDQAALRRFDLKIRFDYLTPEQSCSFFQRVIDKPALRLEGGFLSRSLRDLQLTPGDFSAVIRRCKALDEPLNEIGLLQGLRQEFAMRRDHGSHA